ncbi:MAG: efflux RND transporter periplasmic adaptor subunit [Rhizobiaceae bacterium]|nr:efflux RND transporter periplasmic adaptor subunit [Rhizobiaceae bacterium]
MLTTNDEIETELEASPRQGSKSVFRMIGRGMAQLCLMVLVLFCGFMGMNYFVSLKEDPPSRPPFQTTYTVNTIIAEEGTFQPDLLVYGEVRAAEAVQLRSLVAGKIVSVNPELKVGGKIEAGAELLRIDPFNFETELASAKANIRETEARIAENKARVKIEESRIRSLQDQLRLAENDLERFATLKTRGTATSKQVEDRELIVSQRSQSLEQSELNLVAEKSRLEQLEAVLVRFQRSEMQAERNIEDTLLRAPFSGIVSEKNTGVGRLIGANDMVVAMYEADVLEVYFTLTDERFGRVQADDVGISGREVQVIWSVGGEEFRYPATIDRIGAQITSSRGGVEVIASITGDVAASALRPGAFVEVIVPDKKFDAHFRIPDTALYNDDTIYVVVDGKLQARKIRVHARNGANVILTGNLQTGDEVLTTRIAEISEGLNVRPPTNAAQQPSSSDKLVENTK